MMNDLTTILDALSHYSASPLAWLIVPLLVLYLIKRYFLAGAWSVAQGLIDRYFLERQRHLESQLKLEEDLRTLAERIKEIAEGLWENRRLINEKI